MSTTEKRVAIRHNYYLRHKEEEYASCRKWALAHPEEKHKIQRAYYSENRDEILLRTGQRREQKRARALSLLEHSARAVTADDKEVLAWAKRGQRLSKYLRDTGISKDVIGERCGVSRRTVYDWVHLYRAMSAEMLKKALA